MRMRPARLFVPLFVTMIAAGGARASAQEPLVELSRAGGPITVDGRPDEKAWQDIAPLPLTMYAPVFKGTPSQRSEIRVAYDDEHLYVAGWFYDSDPAGIRVNSLYPDRWNGDDTLAIYIDLAGMKAVEMDGTAASTRFVAE